MPCRTYCRAAAGSYRTLQDPMDHVHTHIHAHMRTRSGAHPLPAVLWPALAAAGCAVSLGILHCLQLRFRSSVGSNETCRIDRSIAVDPMVHASWGNPLPPASFLRVACDLEGPEFLLHEPTAHTVACICIADTTCVVLCQLACMCVHPSALRLVPLALALTVRTMCACICIADTTCVVLCQLACMCVHPSACVLKLISLASADLWGGMDVPMRG